MSSEVLRIWNDSATKNHVACDAAVGNRNEMERIPSIAREFVDVRKICDESDAACRFSGIAKFNRPNPN